MKVLEQCLMRSYKKAKPEVEEFQQSLTGTHRPARWLLFFFLFCLLNDKTDHESLTTTHDCAATTHQKYKPEDEGERRTRRVGEGGGLKLNATDTFGAEAIFPHKERDQNTSNWTRAVLVCWQSEKIDFCINVSGC